MTRPLSRVFLGVAGIIATLISGAILLVPHAFFATNDITLGTDPSLLSEIRAPGGLLASLGLVMMIGAVTGQFVRTGLLTCALTFGGYGFSRVLSVALDGLPAGSLVGAMVLELIIAAIAILFITQLNGTRSVI